MHSKEIVGQRAFAELPFRGIFRNNITISLIIFALVLISAGIFVPTIYQIMNIINVLRIVSIVGIVAIGETFVMVSGEIDISVGSIMSLSLVSGGVFLNLGSLPAILISLLTGTAFGLLNGIAVTKGRMNSLIITLGTLSIYGGLALMIVRGQALYLYNKTMYLWMGKGYIGGIPVTVVFMIVVSAISFFFLSFTKRGHYLYYTGANKVAALCSGINVDRVKILAFSVAGFCAAFAGPFYASQTNRITPIQGVGFEMSAIAVAVLGGTELSGGKGSIIGTIIGALTYGFLLNIVALLKVGTYMEITLKGLMLVVIALIFQNTKRK